MKMKWKRRKEVKSREQKYSQLIKLIYNFLI